MKDFNLCKATRQDELATCSTNSSHKSLLVTTTPTYDLLFSEE